MRFLYERKKRKKRRLLVYDEKVALCLRVNEHKIVEIGGQGSILLGVISASLNGM